MSDDSTLIKQKDRDGAERAQLHEYFDCDSAYLLVAGAVAAPIYASPSVGKSFWIDSITSTGSMLAAVAGVADVPMVGKIEILDGNTGLVVGTVNIGEFVPLNLKHRFTFLVAAVPVAQVRVANWAAPNVCQITVNVRFDHGLQE